MFIQLFLENNVNRKKAFLDLLMEMEDEKLSELQIRDEVTVMIIGVIKINYS